MVGRDAGARWRARMREGGLECGALRVYADGCRGGGGEGGILCGDGGVGAGAGCCVEGASSAAVPRCVARGRRLGRGG